MGTTGLDNVGSLTSHNPIGFQACYGIALLYLPHMLGIFFNRQVCVRSSIMKQWKQSNYVSRRLHTNISIDSESKSLAATARFFIRSHELWRLNDVLHVTTYLKK
jgi:hypothetical protein